VKLHVSKRSHEDKREQSSISIWLSHALFNIGHVNDAYYEDTLCMHCVTVAVVELRFTAVPLLLSSYESLEERLSL